MDPTLWTEIDASRVGAFLFLHAYSRTNPKTIRSKFADAFGLPCDAVVTPCSGSIPYGVLIRVGTKLLAWGWEGISNQTLEPYLFGLTPTLVAQRGNGLNAAISDALAMQPFSGILASFPNYDRVLLSGHSLGGQVALSIASLLLSPQGTNKVGVVTYGSPRPFSEPAPLIPPSFPVIRWMVPYDTITRVPPTFAENLSAYTSLSLLIGQPLGHWFQPRGGRTFDGQGGYEEHSSTGVVGALGAVELHNWATGLPSSLTTNHAFSTYLGAVFDLSYDAPPFWRTPRPKLDAESPSFTPMTVVQSAGARRLGLDLPAMMGCQSGPSSAPQGHGPKSGPVI